MEFDFTPQVEQDSEELGYLDWANSELKANRFSSSQEKLNTIIMDVLEIFVENGVTPYQAKRILDDVKRLNQFKPLGPIYDKESDWKKITPRLWVHKKCSSVFKDNERAWDIDNGMYLPGNGSNSPIPSSPLPINFPYMPKLLLEDDK